MSLDIRRIMQENQYITFRMFPCEPFHEDTLEVLSVQSSAAVPLTLVWYLGQIDLFKFLKKKNGTSIHFFYLKLIGLSLFSVINMYKIKKKF